MFLLLNPASGVRLSGIVASVGTAGNEPCSLWYVSSSLHSAEPTEKIVFKVSFEVDLRIAGLPRSVFGKQATGNASTLCSSLCCAATDTGGMLKPSEGVGEACTVYTGSGGAIDCEVERDLDLLRHLEVVPELVDELEMSDAGVLLFRWRSSIAKREAGGMLCDLVCLWDFMSTFGFAWAAQVCSGDLGGREGIKTSLSEKSRDEYFGGTGGACLYG